MSAEQPSASGEQPRLIYGELRRGLEEIGNPWTVDSLASDDELVPLFPTGGREPESDDAEPPAVRLDEEIDLRGLIAEIPPNDPDLRHRWEEAGVDVGQHPSEATSDRAEIPEEANPRPESEQGRP